MNKILEIGDRVKVIDTKGCRNARMGDIGIIIGMDGKGEKSIIEVKRERDGDHLRMFRFRFKLIEPKDKLAYLTKIKPYGIVGFCENIDKHIYYKRKRK